MKIFLPSLIGVLSLAFDASAPLQAALLVDWGGEYVTANRPYSNPSSGSLTSFGGFFEGNPRLLSPSETVYSGTSSRFYGQLARNSGGGTFSPTNGIINAGTSDRIEIKLDNNDISGLFLWKQEDFLNGFQSGAIDLAGGSTISLNTFTNVNTATGGRAVVRTGGGYYISEVISPASGTTGLINRDLTTLNWFTYNPASALSTIGSAAGLVNDGIISNVTEIGFYYHVAGGPNAVRIDSVEFNYVAVPEPASLALLAGACGILAIRRRKRTHA